MTTRTVSIIEAEIKTTVTKLNALKAELKEARKTQPSNYEQNIVDFVNDNATEKGISRAAIAEGLGIEADQKLTNALLELRKTGKLRNEGNKRASVWFPAVSATVELTEDSANDSETEDETETAVAV